jgi:hypothetical protein
MRRNERKVWKILKNNYLNKFVLFCIQLYNNKNYYIIQENLKCRQDTKSLDIIFTFTNKKIEILNILRTTL